MNYTLILNIYSKESSNINLNSLLTNIFNTAPKEGSIPISVEIKKEIEKQYGISKTFRLTISATSYESAVFNLLKQLESFGFDWKFRGPVKISSDKYTFLASLFPEYGTFYQSDFNGMTAILEE